MKRDWDLIRKILIELEKSDDMRKVLQDVEGYEREKVGHHIFLLKEAGLVDANCTRLHGMMISHATSLTWGGHEFLGKIRSETLWKKVGKLLQEKGLDLSFETIKVAATKLVIGLID